MGPNIQQYRERGCDGFTQKAIEAYHFSGKNKNGVGYKQHIKDDGFIIAISMAQIPFYNMMPTPSIDISCFFPSSPFPTIPISINKDGSHDFKEPYHSVEEEFKKTNGSPIGTNYFLDSKFNYVSAVLISHTGYVFFPDADKYEPIQWGTCRNDFLLIHNPLAKVPLPLGALKVVREAVASISVKIIETKL